MAVTKTLSFMQNTKPLKVLPLFKNQQYSGAYTDKPATTGLQVISGGFIQTI